MTWDHNSELTLAGLAHDLNNIFQTISDTSEVIGHDPKWSEAATVILRAVEYGRKITAGLAGEQEHADLDTVIDAAAQMAQNYLSVAEASRATVRKSFDPGLCVAVPPTALERVFTNLFINAARAARESGNRTCTIAVSALEHAGRVQIQVEDDGPGIPPDILSHIFAPGISTGTRRKGLGLHIVHSIVRDYKGTIQVVNAVTGGARFTILLPSAS